MTATWVDGGYVNGTAEQTWTAGLLWVQAPWGYALSLLIGGVFFAPIMRRHRYTTLLDPFEQRFGRRAAACLYLPGAGRRGVLDRRDPDRARDDVRHHPRPRFHRLHRALRRRRHRLHASPAASGRSPSPTSRSSSCSSPVSGSWCRSSRRASAASNMRGRPTRRRWPRPTAPVNWWAWGDTAAAARVRRHSLARLLPAGAGGARRADGAAAVDCRGLRVPGRCRAAGAARDPRVRRRLGRRRDDGARAGARARVAAPALHAAARGRARARRGVGGGHVVGRRLGAVGVDDGGVERLPAARPARRDGRAADASWSGAWW